MMEKGDTLPRPQNGTLTAPAGMAQSVASETTTQILQLHRREAQGTGQVPPPELHHLLSGISKRQQRNVGRRLVRLPGAKCRRRTQPDLRLPHLLSEPSKHIIVAHVSNLSFAVIFKEG